MTFCCKLLSSRIALKLIISGSFLCCSPSPCLLLLQVLEFAVHSLSVYSLNLLITITFPVAATGQVDYFLSVVMLLSLVMGVLKKYSRGSAALHHDSPTASKLM